MRAAATSARGAVAAALLASLAGACATDVADAEGARPAPAAAEVTQLRLERFGGSHYRYYVTLTAEGEALWEGIEAHPPHGRHVSSFDPVAFERLATDALAAEAAWTGSRSLFSIAGDYARLTIRRADGTANEVGLIVLGTDTLATPVIEEIETFADGLDWTPLQPPPAMVNQSMTGFDLTTPHTTVALESGQHITLEGDFTEVQRLWPDTALVYRHEYAIWSLDGGSRRPRKIHEYPRKEWTRMSAPSWSQDGETYYVWLHHTEQLVGIDAATGSKRQVMKLPTHVWSYEMREHPDPHAVWRRQGLVEDVARGRLLQLVQEESNEEVGVWQRSEQREGGHQLLSIPIEGGPAVPLTGSEPLPGEASYWDLALGRGELYTVCSHDEVTVRTLEGRPLESIALPFRWLHGIVLSPDERWLLVERRFRPGYEVDSLSTKGMSREELQQRIAGSNGGFVLYDLDRKAFRDGPEGGHECAWSPDSTQVAVLDYWTLSIHDVASGTTRLLAAQEPEEPGDVSPGYWEGPVWSSDGRRLAVRLAHTPTLLLDLERREFMLYDEYVQDATWAPVSAPFGTER